MQGTAMRQIVEFIAFLACAMFTGAAVYITFVEHPARMQCGTEIAATEFAPSYRRATLMQALVQPWVCCHLCQRGSTGQVSHENSLTGKCPKKLCDRKPDK
jgi:hypothetical protein